MVDLPAPEEPTRATVWPGSTRKLMPCSTSSPPRVSRVAHVLQRGERDLVRRGVGEADVVELHGERPGRGGDGVGLLLDERLEVQDFEDPLEADQGAHDLHAGVGERGERRVEAGEQQGQHDDVARGQLPGSARKPPRP